MNTDSWVQQHGAFELVYSSEVSELRAAAARVLHLLLDFNWHSADEIRTIAGTDGFPASEGLRRMRDLRPVLRMFDFQIERRRSEDSRLFDYRISRVPKEQI